MITRDGDARSGKTARQVPTTIQVATSTDGNYLPYAAAMAQSLAAHRHSSTTVELTIMHRGVSARDRKKLESAADGITVCWVSMAGIDFQRWGAESDSLVLTPHYFRCLIPKIYPAATRRVLYLDADIIVLEDLSPLWSWQLGGLPVAAVGDLMSIIKDAISHWREIGLNGDAPYFNSGVMVIDLARWRAEKIGDRVLDRCRIDRHRLLIRGRWNQHDQYGFNVVLQNRWMPLPKRWNHYPERSAERPAIVHFLGDIKPGAPGTLPEFTRLFTEAVDATPWAGWRPAGFHPSSAAVRSAGSREMP